MTTHALRSGRRCRVRYPRASSSLHLDPFGININTSLRANMILEADPDSKVCSLASSQQVHGKVKQISARGARTSSQEHPRNSKYQREFARIEWFNGIASGSI